MHNTLHHNPKQPHLRGLTIVCLLILLFLVGIPLQSAQAGPPRPEPDDDADTMLPERLAIPVLSDNPSQLELGNSVYYFHCMPCHGDRGQGLTDEFRGLWVEDHQNCWARGCHLGRIEDEGFIIPKYIPGLLSKIHFSTPESLYSYLKATHPPQRPGALMDEEYWSVTAFVLNISGQLDPSEEIGPYAEKKTPFNEALGLLATSVFLALFTAVILVSSHPGSRAQK